MNLTQWTLETDADQLAWLGLDCTEGSTNVLSAQVMQELSDALTQLEAQPPRGLVVYSRKRSGFIAGADVKEFPLMTDADAAFATLSLGHAIVARLEALPCPSLAVLNGAALGGGLELALACTGRLAFESDRKQLGLPEVQLGLHPGLGGTVRTVELLGARAALDLMLKGKPVTPATALRLGLVDALTGPDTWREDAGRWLAQAPPKRPVSWLDRIINLGPVRGLVARRLRAQLAAKLQQEHYPAPFALLELWRRKGGSRDSFTDEARSFARLVFTPTSQNLVRVFFLQDRLKSLGKSSARQFTHVHVIGAGTMGADIAAWCALRGLSVTLQDREQKYVDAGLERARKGLTRKLRDAAKAEAVMERLLGDSAGSGVDDADVIIEAIFENLEAKQALFRDVEQRARPDALLATNTSSIPLAEIATALAVPARLIGLHFFNPVARMPLVEVVQDAATAAEHIDDGTAFVKQIGKLPLPCQGLPGFLVNRILAPYMDEAFRLHQEGYAPETIDRAATDFGMPVGPLALADSVGLDILLHVAGIVGSTIGRELPPGLEQLVQDGRLGEKSGQGFYVWQDGKPQAEANPAPPAPALQERLILSLVNEAAACVGDQVVADADLADAGTIFGAGFAPFRGGPLCYARQRGLTATMAALRALQTEHGERFAPAAGWQKIAPDNSASS
ncbi:MAG: 3-hydroxyacyl-CoA dehydrogenase NAD-binding domain-containing protein [Gammaproteobacteria bacterium]|jgi:3-hydroxyacyl-CoA dehydrogenase/enoyl-CoA hydratase/3-hydroxybutyryl-CoA epimerase|nr:3-hydroxyacyl-CoA dehydrogenase NAD-binding domain-containing protein [Gammaproteobacteria bacterium]